MPKDKKKEAERQRGIRLKKKKETEKLKAFWAYAQGKIPEFVGEFLVIYEQNSSSINHEDQVVEDQETPKGTEDQSLHRSYEHKNDNRSSPSIYTLHPTQLTNQGWAWL